MLHTPDHGEGSKKRSPERGSFNVPLGSIGSQVRGSSFQIHPVAWDSASSQQHSRRTRRLPTTQTTKWIKKIDPLIWDPILLRGTFKELYWGIYFLDPAGGLGIAYTFYHPAPRPEAPGFQHIRHRAEAGDSFPHSLPRPPEGSKK